MEAKLLMIGDWVLVDSKPTKVDNVDIDSINTTYVCGEVEDYIKEEKVSPIPLTPEILEKNGLDKVPELSMVINRDTMPLYHSPMLHYVHELQRALRLCGLNDLADGFKI